MKKIPLVFATLLAAAIAFFTFKVMAACEEANLPEIFHYSIPLWMAYFSRRYIVKKESLRTMRELAYLAFERSPKTKLRGQFLRYPKEAERYLSAEERDKFRIAGERLGLRPW